MAITTPLSSGFRPVTLADALPGAAPGTPDVAAFADGLPAIGAASGPREEGTTRAIRTLSPGLAQQVQALTGDQGSGIESFLALGAAPLAHPSLYAAVTRDSQTVAVIDNAGNVSVRSPADARLRDSMSEMSDPAERTDALAALLGGQVQLATGKPGEPDLAARLGELTPPSSSQPALTLAAAVPANSVADGDLAATDAEFRGLFDGGDETALFKEITGDGMDGYWKWQLKQLTAKIAAEVMAERGLSQAEVAALPPEQRIQLEKDIIAEVRRRVLEIIREEMKKRQAATAAHTATTQPQDASAAPAAQATQPAKSLLDFMLE